MSTLRETLGPALGKIASGLYVVTARLDGAPFGMLCSFVEQAAFTPPMISLALGQDRPLHAALATGGVFGLHILSTANKELMKSFARGHDPAAFAIHPQVENAHGVPQFAEAWAFLLARVTGRLECGDHFLYAAEVLEGNLQHPDGEPMTRVRSNGFHY